MYDVQPVNPGEWTTPPFEARLVPSPAWGQGARIIRGRGAQNQKGPQRAFLNAVESIRAVSGRLPVNLMFICEGEEEMGSPNLPAVVAKYRERLATAHGVLFPTTNLGRDGRAGFALGNKGIVYMELETHGGPHGGPKAAEIHSSLKAAVDSPVWRLVQALASMTDDSGNRVRVEGFGSSIRKPTARELEVFETFLADYDEAAAKRAAGIDRFADGASKREALRRLWFEPSLNIDGIWGGYTGPGTKTILPHKANAKIDFRLVPDQRASDVAALVRAHLDKHGFTDVKVNFWNGYDPSQSDPDSSLVRAALDVCRSHGVPTQTSLRMAGSAPHYLFTRDLNLPLISFGLGHGGGAHSKDEFLVVHAPLPARGLAFMEKAFVDLLYRFAEM
jgi:acetylornithine deacetylase/succinyl-diaminopimelate desuccinylase-like protein